MLAGQEGEKGFLELHLLHILLMFNLKYVLKSVTAEHNNFVGNNSVLQSLTARFNRRSIYKTI
jgi:hypothetical protein